MQMNESGKIAMGNEAHPFHPPCTSVSKCVFRESLTHSAPLLAPRRRAPALPPRRGRSPPASCGHRGDASGGRSDCHPDRERLLERPPTAPSRRGEPIRRRHGIREQPGAEELERPPPARSPVGGLALVCQVGVDESRRPDGSDEGGDDRVDVLRAQEEREGRRERQ
eukprot:601090-Prymnesium_polylepis.1